jgi:hypothetical protein
MANRSKSNSIHAMATAVYAEQSGIPWPGTVKKLPHKGPRDTAHKIFAEVLSTRSEQDWRPSDVALAARLANTNTEADIVFDKLARVGFAEKKTGSNGQQIKTRHHLHDVWLGLSRQGVQLQQKLGLTGLPAQAVTVRNHARADPAQAHTPRPKGPAPDWAKLARDREAKKDIH